MRIIIAHAFVFMSLSLIAVTPNPQAGIQINNTDLPTLINTPGRYGITETLTYAAIDATPAITIATSNVIIDMHDQILQQSGGVLSVTGIQIGSGLTNINIYNGTLTNFSSSGISIGSGCSVLFFDDITINGAGNRGIEFVGIVGSTIMQTEITNCIFMTSCTLSTADNVVTLSNTTDIIMQDCLFSANGNSSATNPIVGVKLTNAARYFFLRVGVSNSSGNADLRGFSFNNSSGGLIDTCRVSSGRAFAATGVSRGIHLEAGTGSTVNFFNNCIVAGLTGNTVDAYLSDTGCNGNMFKDCMAAANVATGATGVISGFHSTNNSKVSFRNCEARGGTAAASTASPYGSYGFRLDTVTSSAIINCLADYNSDAAGSSVGIYGIQSTSCTFKENQITGNTQGFDFEGTFTLNTFVKNIAERNTNASQYIGFPTTAVSDNMWSSSMEVISGPWSNIGIS